MFALNLSREKRREGEKRVLTTNKGQCKEGENGDKINEINHQKNSPHDSLHFSPNTFKNASRLNKVEFLVSFPLHSTVCSFKTKQKKI